MSKAFIRFWLLALVIISVFIRVHGANNYYYNADEAMHTGIASGDTLAQVLQFSHYEIHPPALYILTHYWMMLSHDPAFVRGLPLCFGVLLILLYYRIGKALNGKFTGLCCAVLIGVSNGCIIQSYVVRQYIFFLFFISLAYYYYLLWKSGRKTGALTAYSIWSTVACLCHFSAIFCIFCIATYELLGMRKRKEAGQIQWMLVNAVIGVIALSTYHQWQPILVPLKSYFATHTAGSLTNLMVHTLFYPLATPGYVLPGYASALILLVCQVWVLIAPPHFIRNLSDLRALLTLNAMAYLLGMLLVLTRFYPEPGTRHSMWILPFVIPPAGWMLADLCEWLNSKLIRSQSATALLLLGAACLTYSPETRFHDGSEYVWPQDQWRSFNRYLQALGPKDLIVTEKDDGIMLANLYRAMGTDAFTGVHMAALAPYRNTHILFNPYYPRNYSRNVLLATLEEAQTRHMFDGMERLVFLRMAWSRSPLTDLMLCDMPDKQLVAFAPLDTTHALSRNDIYGRFAVIMIVPKVPFLKEALASNGKVANCLDGKHDMVPGFMAVHH